MHTDLVGAAGFDADFAITLAAQAFQHLEMAERRLSSRVYLDMALAALAQANVQGRIHRHQAVRHASAQQRQVALGDAGAVVFAQQRLQFAQGRTLLGHDQQPGGVAIEPVHQFQRLLRPQRPQGFDRAEGNPAATVAGHP